MLEITSSYSQKPAALKGALLLYSGRATYDSSDETTFATVHTVKEINSQMEIMPGRLLTQHDLATLTSALSETDVSRVQDIHWFDESVLAKGKDRLIWWTPPGVQSMFFEESSMVDKPLKGNGICPVPGLVWIAFPGTGLFVYAFKGKSRPNKDTTLYQAPFFNVWSSGGVCIGSASLPNSEKAWETKAWEHMFFGSRFTHPNFRQKDRLVKGVDPSTFWGGLLVKPTRNFPEKRLVSVPISVGDLLDPLFVDNLKKLQRAQGEF